MSLLGELDIAGVAAAAGHAHPDPHGRRWLAGREPDPLVTRRRVEPRGDVPGVASINGS